MQDLPLMVRRSVLVIVSLLTGHTTNRRPAKKELSETSFCITTREAKRAPSNTFWDDTHPRNPPTQPIHTAGKKTETRHSQAPISCCTRASQRVKETSTAAGPPSAQRRRESGLMSPGLDGNNWPRSTAPRRADETQTRENGPDTHSDASLSSPRTGDWTVVCGLGLPGEREPLNPAGCGEISPSLTRFVLLAPATSTERVANKDRTVDEIVPRGVGGRAGWMGGLGDAETLQQIKRPRASNGDDIAKARATWESEEGPWVQAIGAPRR
ncbi:hypothetical protein EDB80DRAFT_688061 [Ilyonectria destructans]|nr:hypothetical protein EDB80DRAFT_688061 [Ilyonectria destructans]